MIKKRVGIMGAGTIGRTLIDALTRLDTVEIVFVFDQQPALDNNFGLPSNVFVSEEEKLLDIPVDLVIEAAVPSIVAQFAPRFLKTSDFCAFSCTALADSRTEQAIKEASLAFGRRFYVPHGAVLGLDGITDGRELIEKLTITTTKSGKSLGLDPNAEGVVFEGTAREVCARFPRNVNVHAALAIAGIGFDRTASRIVAVPGQVANEHAIVVEGNGFAWDLKITSQSLGGVTGAYTPHSAVGSIMRILSRDPGVIVV